MITMAKRDLKKRHIDGERWAVHGTCSGRKNYAEREAKELRKRGIRARVIKTKSWGYVPYMSIKDYTLGKKRKRK